MADESGKPIQLPTCRECGREHWAMFGEDDDLCIDCVKDLFKPMIEIGRANLGGKHDR